MTKTDEKRIKVLNYSLRLEKMASYILGFILDIEDYTKSKSFGNTGTTLSFNQKINLLLDYGAILPEDRFRLDACMNIRNQLMHNFDCTTFEDIFSNNSSMNNGFQKLYPTNFEGDDKEIIYDRCVDSVFKDSFIILGSLKGGIEKKITLLAEHRYHKAALDKILSVGKEKLAEIGKEIENNEFDFSNKEILVKRLITLSGDIFLNSIKGLAAEIATNHNSVT